MMTALEPMASPTMFRLKVTQIIDPQCFMAQIGTESSMEEFVEQEKAFDVLGQQLSEDPTNVGINEDTNIGDHVLAFSSSGDKWVRARINFVDSEHGEVDVLCIDYGTTELVKVEHIIYQSDDLVEAWLPQAHRCTLVAVQPIANIWIKRAISYFQSLVEGKNLWAEVIEEDPQGSIVVDILHRGKFGSFVSVSKDLHQEGFAKLTPPGNAIGKVPDFNISQLQKAATAVPQDTEVEDNQGSPQDDLDNQLYLDSVGATHEVTPWVRSDVTIGPAFKPNLKPDVISTIQEEIRMMKEANSTDSEGDNSSVNSNSPQKAWNKKTKSSLLGYNPSLTGDEVTDSTPDLSTSPSPYHPADSEDHHRQPQQTALGLSTPSPQHPADNEEHNLQPQQNRQRKTRNRLWRHSGHQSRKVVEIPRFKNMKKHSKNSQSAQRLSPGNEVASSLDQPIVTTAVPPPADDPPAHPTVVPPLSSPRKAPQNDHHTNPPAVVENLQQSEDSGSDQDMLRRGSRDRRYGPNKSKAVQLKHEYEWQRRKVERQVGKVLHVITEENFQERIAELKFLIYLKQSKLTPLPGPKELQVCLEEILIHAIEKGTSVNLTLKMLESLKDDEEFTMVMNQVLSRLQLQYVQCKDASPNSYVSRYRGNTEVTTNVNIRRHMKTFCQLLGHLFVEVQSWPALPRDAIVVFVTNMVERWCIFNKGGQHPSPGNLQSVYLTCLSALLAIAGEMLEIHWPAKMNEGFTELRAKTLSQVLPENVRSLILDLLLQRAAGWSKRNELTPDHAKALTSRKSKETQTVNEDLELRETCMVATNTDLCTMDIGTQTSVVLSSSDPYTLVRCMLYDLDMEPLLENFTQNAVRDSLLEMDFSELRILLREIGLLPGHIWELKNYLEQRRRSGAASSHYKSSSCSPTSMEMTLGGCSSTRREEVGSATQGGLTQPSITLLSPDNFMVGPAFTVAPVVSSSLNTALGGRRSSPVTMGSMPSVVPNLQDVELTVTDDHNEQLDLVTPDSQGLDHPCTVLQPNTSQCENDMECEERPSPTPSYGPLSDRCSPGIHDVVQDVQNEEDQQTAAVIVNGELTSRSLEPRDKLTSAGEAEVMLEEDEASETVLAAGAESEPSFDEVEVTQEELLYYQNMFKDVVLFKNEEDRDQLDDYHLDQFAKETRQMEFDLKSAEEQSTTNQDKAHTPPVQEISNSPPFAFGSRSRQCTICGTADHRIYECPERHTKFFL